MSERPPRGRGHRLVDVRLVGEGRETAARWGVAEEEPIEIGFNGAPWAVMLATPLDLEDFARGLAFTEGALREPGAIAAIDIRAFPEGWTVDVTAPPAALTERAEPRRRFEGRTGCGLCGLESLADLAAARPVRAAGLDPSAVRAAFAALRDAQPLNAATRSAHAAAWCDLNGAVRLVREDVGRHNALDKVIGALLAEGADPQGGFFAMTSRLSYELVLKAAAFGAGALAAISAPTARALALAQAAGMRLACAAPQGDIALFHPEPSRAAR